MTLQSSFLFTTLDADSWTLQQSQGDLNSYSVVFCCLTDTERALQMRKEKHRCGSREENFWVVFLTISKDRASGEFLSVLSSTPLPI